MTQARRVFVLLDENVDKQVLSYLRAGGTTANTSSMRARQESMTPRMSSSTPVDTITSS
jgi:hypothetical protein